MSGNTRQKSARESAITLLSFVVSLAAMFISVYSAYSTTQNNIISLRPNLDFTFALDEGGEEMGIFLENTGNGPAVIKKFEIFFDGERLQDRWRDVSLQQSLEEVLKEEGSYSFHTIGYNSYLAKDKSRGLFRIPTRYITNKEKYADLIRKRILVHIQYCSMHEECTYTCSVTDDDVCETKASDPSFRTRDWMTIKPEGRVERLLRWVRETLW